MLDSRAIAIDGVGYSSRVLALAGLFALGAVAQPPAEERGGRRTWLHVQAEQQRLIRARQRREDEEAGVLIVMLAQLGVFDE